MSDVVILADGEVTKQKALRPRSTSPVAAPQPTPRNRDARRAGGHGPSLVTGERYLAPTPWSPARPEHLVVCCSDGRWHAQVEEFLRSQVSSRADLYMVPGGPAEFNVWSSSLEERVVAVKTLRFLMEHHQLRAIWLIAHQDCAYYRSKLQPLDAGYILRRQLHDLAQTAESIVKAYPNVEVHRIYAGLEQNRVTFTRLSASSADTLSGALTPHLIGE